MWAASGGILALPRQAVSARAAARHARRAVSTAHAQPHAHASEACVVREFGPPSVLRVESVADAELRPGQARVQMVAAGVNPADTYIRSGAYNHLPTLPWTPGLEGAGVVVDAGAGEHVAVGDHVMVGTISGRTRGVY